jgi:uncharacterized RDD family membrane protein YckC
MQTTTNSSQDLLNDLLPDETAYKANKGARWFAALIDFFIIAIFAFILLYCFGVKTTEANGSVSYHVEGFNAFLTYFVPWFIILPLIEGINNGQSIGKAIFGIRSTLADGSPITFSAAVVRHLLDFVDYMPFFGMVGLIVAGNSAHQQRVGDMVAKTIVIKAK